MRAWARGEESQQTSLGCVCGSTQEVGAARRISGSGPACPVPDSQGLVSPVPVRAARSMGADLVLAVDISSKPRFQETDTLPRVLLQAFAIMSQHLAARELLEADLVVSPSVGDRGSADFSDRVGAIALGAQAMRAALPGLQSRIRQWRPPA